MSEDRLKTLLANTIALLYGETDFNNAKDFTKYLKDQLGITETELEIL